MRILYNVIYVIIILLSYTSYPFSEGWENVYGWMYNESIYSMKIIDDDGYIMA